MSLAFAFGTLVFAFFFLLVLAIGQSVLPAVVVGLAVAIIWNVLAWRQSDSIVLDLCDAKEADPIEQARLTNVVDGLRAAMGVPYIDLYVVDDPALNALALGRDPSQASLVVTQGLLDNTSLVELEAIVALQLYRIKTNDIAPQTLVVGTFGVPLVLAEAMDRFEFLVPVLRLPTPWIDAVIARVHNAQTEIETDIEATQFTRYPPALASVLGKMAGRSAPAVATPVTAHLWAAPPLAPSAHPNASRLHAPLPERVAVLEEL